MIFSVKRKGHSSWTENQDEAFKNNPFNWITPLTTAPRNPNKFITGLKDEAEEHEFEELMRVDKGTFAPNSKYWEDYLITVTESTVFNTDIVEDRLHLKILSTLPSFAMDEDEIESKPYSTFVLVNSDKQDELLLKKHSSKIEAYAILEKSTPQELRMILTVCGVNTYDMSDTGVKSNFVRMVESGGSNISRIVKASQDKGVLNLRYFLKQAMFHNIVTTNGISYVYGQIVLGMSEGEVIKYFNAKSEVNQRIYLEIKSQIASISKKDSIDIEA